MRRLWYGFIFILCLQTYSHAFTQNLVLDTKKSSIQFDVKNFGLKTSGHFDDFSVTATIDMTHLGTAVLKGQIEASSINTANNKRDDHLRREDYFNVENYPVISLNSERIYLDTNNNYVFEGLLTIKGKSEKIKFPISIDEIDNEVLITGKFTINRKIFKVGGSSLILGKKVNVDIKCIFSIE